MGEPEERVALDALRRLLLHEEQDRLAALDAELREPERLAAHLGHALPLAIKQSKDRDSRLVQALTPILEEVIQTSIRRNPRLMAEILFPIIGRAVRKAVWEAWSQLIQTVNGALETRVSLKSLRWRWIAWRTGRSFAEIVLAQTFVYRVEQVFLIHRESGLLLAHEMREAGVARDKELVSAMLTAIQDFVRDSFEVEEETPLGALEVGGLKVWIEQGPHAYLASVIRGNPPEELHGVLRDTLEQVHFELETELQTYDGEGDQIATAGQILLGAMLYERQEDERGGVPWYAVFIAAVLTLTAGWLSYRSFIARQQLDAVTEALDGTPGYRVLEVRRSGDGFRLEGFRDPLAPPPETVLTELVATSRLDVSLTPYIALDPELILERARQMLSPPDGVRLDLEAEGRLVATGSADAEWSARFEMLAPLVPGVVSIDNRVASESITRSQPLPDRSRALTEELASWQMRFEVNQAVLTTEQQDEIEIIAEKISELLGIADEQNEILSIVIRGFADASGSLAHNRALALQRAEAARDALIAAGIPPRVLQVRGFTSQSEETEHDRLINLAIQFD